ncbi:MAG: Gx transporter family protein [Oscillospiraceae bacterium]|nr:Gx transporter family protein [Oscillospiraceae bacterium]
MKIRQITFLGIVLAIVFVLSAMESLLLTLPFLPPHARPGLSNIAVMYCLLCVGYRQAVGLNAAKSLFVLLTRGPTAGLLSLCGGMLSIAVIVLLLKLFDGKGAGGKMSYASLSVAGAISHNIGQFAAVMVILSTPAMVYFLPTLIISGIVTGLLTGTLLKTLMPALTRIRRE